MADVTGPISTLPGTGYAVPDGMMCDDHPDRPATRRVQGETDSMGCEMHDMCDECFAQLRLYTPDGGPCDWCKKEATDRRATRDYDEGMYGRVYYVCGACRKRANEEAEEELRESGYYDDCWMDDNDEPEICERWEDDVLEVPVPRKVPITCRCGQKWDPKHKCRAKLIADNPS